MRASFLALSFVAAVGCSRPKPVQLTLQSAQLSSIGPGGVSVALMLDAHNPNSFPISASAVNATIQLTNGSELGHGSSPASFQIPAEGDTTLPAQLGLQWTNLTLLAPYALSGQPLPYRIVGTAHVGGEQLNVELPFSISGQLTREQVLNAGLSGLSSKP